MIINGGGAGGTGSDECTARLSDIPAGLKAVTADSNDEAGVGTMAMTGNAQAAHVLAGETFYANNYKTKLTGIMTVGSILAFSAQAYSGRQILLTWQNPYAASGRPYSGVVIKYATWGYPAWDSGEPVIYVGYGNNAAPGGWSQVIVTMPALATTYYFTALSYATTSFGDLYVPNYHANTVFNSAAATGGPVWLTFTTSQTYMIPAGYTKADIFCVGGGGGGSRGNDSVYGAGAGAGYTNKAIGISVNPGSSYLVTVGAGGAAATSRPAVGYNGGASSFGILCSAAGGYSAYPNGGAGGSGGGGAGRSGSSTGGDGGSNGSNGRYGDYADGTGQGTTTKAWGDAAGTLYAGGGGGGGGKNLFGVGGSGGGGNGGASSGAGSAGATNTGGGGGGGGISGSSAGAGGSGIVLLKLY